MTKYEAEQFKGTMKRIVEEINRTIDKQIKEKNKETDNNKNSKKITRTDILDSYEPDKRIQGLPPFPMSKHTWYKYKGFVDGDGGTLLKGIKIQALCDICEYTNVSADYFLGFNDSKVKSASAEQIQKDFPFSDETLNRLHKMKNDERFPLITRYRKISDLEYIDFIVQEFSGYFLNLAISYFDALDKFEEHKKEYFNPQTGYVLDKYDSATADKAINEYQDYEKDVKIQEFYIATQLIQYLNRLRTNLNADEGVEK